MIAIKFLFVLIALGYPFSAHAGVLGGAWTPCPRSDPKLNECMVSSMQKFIPHVKSGIPKFNLPSIDPATLGDVDFSTSNLKMAFKGIVMKGLLTDVQVMLVEAEPDNYKLRVNLRSPAVNFEGQYELNGKLSSMPVSGSGGFAMTYENATLDLTYIGKPLNKDGKMYMEVVETKLMIIPGMLRIKVENLFNGNKELSDNFHNFVHENWREIFDEFKPKIWAHMGGFFMKTFGPVFAGVPQDDIYAP